jgi:lipoic acid synthetase
VERLLDGLDLQTVCVNAKCPNLSECYGAGTATFMILGTICTRDCRFCAVESGRPQPPDPGEPARVAEAAKRLKLRHVVITSVTRDDLADGGASHFAQTVREVRRACDASVEILTPDFKGDERSLDIVCNGDGAPDVFNHNIETVPRLYPTVRPQADYARSIDLLRRVKEKWPRIVTKSGIMVGLGESGDEIFGVMDDLRAAGCDAITMGQYLQPSPAHLPVARFVEPDEFAGYGAAARRKGFRLVASGPFVRSSYHAGELLGNELA